MKKKQRDKMKKYMVYFLLISFLVSILPMIFTR
ncbi:DUF4044 domain-containing protein [Clostridium tetani]|uniref:DUF4044 domain-containing protein n=1 Tax=Clostridium tetani TaxID=1513 RepID=A0A4Q0UWC9_CLOTA|nr:DUF4044 domain-containing protein [Clostridium tetani]AVP53703.1 DUF4044 domain-containing protein [Clostridium tetani]QBD84807.1 DUF4044 domain-containing protein [Clostridium tetani]QBD87159.1 DUF4044 domain-containing protein [Clostridium tetani]RXI37808.1 DUF4044 domain-containing protein [Clostridium tetani]RXI46838.1 DUF4044 domain-containing protein [Clostridium tetani]